MESVDIVVSKQQASSLSLYPNFFHDYGTVHLDLPRKEGLNPREIERPRNRTEKSKKTKKEEEEEEVKRKQGKEKRKKKKEKGKKKKVKGESRAEQRKG